MKNSPFFLLIIVIILSLFGWGYIPLRDAPSLFDYADKRSFFHIPFSLDVLSNIPFLIVGLYGFKKVYNNKNELFYFGLFLSLSSTLTAFSSAYFHWNPTPDTLIFDRLTMTFGFSSIISVIIADRINLKLGHYLLALLIPIGLFTVLGYHWDILSLRPYILLQYGGIVYCLIACFLLKANLLNNKIFLAGVGLYIVAKVFEHFDHQIFKITGIISGHSLKHLVAAGAIYTFLTIYKDHMKSTTSGLFFMTKTRRAERKSS
jgi:hypothetical protein